MNNNPIRFNPGRLVMLIAVVSLVMVGMRAMKTPQPIRAATIDLEKVYAELKQLAQAKIALELKGAEIQKENEKRQATLKQLDADMTIYVIGTPKYEEAQAQLIQETIIYDGWVKFQDIVLDRERSLAFEKAYNDVKEALATISEQDGYDIVFLNDSIKPLERGTSVSIQQQISARRILYCRDAIDITDDLIVRMNNDYNNPGR